MLIKTDDIIKVNCIEIVFVNHKKKLMNIIGSMVTQKNPRLVRQKQDFSFMEQTEKISKLQLI